MYSIYNCLCHISPRNLHSSFVENDHVFLFNTKKDFINVCIECGGSGGSVGNVNHRENCMYSGCLHDGVRYSKGINIYGEYSEEYIQSLNFISIDEQINHRNSYGRWDYNQPTENIRNYHIKCMGTRKDEIELIRRKMARNLMFKTFALIQIKTGKDINLSSNEKWYFDGDNYIKKWVNILCDTK